MRFWNTGLGNLGSRFRICDGFIKNNNLVNIPRNFLFLVTKKCGLAVEALAGLASKEDITGVALRKAGEGSPATRQWSHPLLLRVKGRRHPLTSVVRPHYSSINQGDSFVLITQSQVSTNPWFPSPRTNGKQLCTEMNDDCDDGGDANEWSFVLSFTWEKLTETKKSLFIERTAM